jgi:hypothetical protein
VDGKLARVKMLERKIGEFEHLLNKLIEYGWYFSIALYLSASHGEAPFIMATALILFHLADEIQREFFHHFTNSRISNAGKFDEKFQLIAASRNTLMWTLLPFALYNQWYAGFAVICAYGIITFFVHQARVVYHLKNMMKANNDTNAGNFKKTKIL